VNLTLTAIRKHIRRAGWNGRDFIARDSNRDVFFGQCEYASTSVSEMLTGVDGRWSLRVRGWYTGPVTVGADWGWHPRGQGVAHSWVVYNGKIIDPTWWAFENAKPAVYVFEANDPRFVADDNAYEDTQMSMVKMRQAVEKSISKKVVNALLTAGFAISVDNGGDDYELAHSTNGVDIVKAMFLADEDRLYAEKDGKTFGWVYLIYGNDGWDVINDYTVNLEPYIGEGTAVQKEIEKWED
jgi:hypothetical protein